jgi:hypothetical protein
VVPPKADGLATTSDSIQQHQWYHLQIKLRKLYRLLS